jgi:hypothetical protein
LAKPLSAKELGALWGEMTKIEVLVKVKISSPFADFAKESVKSFFVIEGWRKIGRATCSFGYQGKSLAR